MHDRNWRAARRGALGAALSLIAGLGLLAAPTGAQNAQPNPEVRVTTNMGSFVIELRPHRAPLTVKDFLHYVRSGFYTNTLIHRVVTNFIIQGGGYEATPPYKLKPTGPPVVNESGNGLENQAGTVGLARGIDPDSGNSQFYINLVDNPELDPLPTRWGYTVFGKVIEGMTVVEHIGVVPTGKFGPFKQNAPLKPVVIKSIQLVTPPGTGSGSSSASSTGPAAAGAAASGTPASTSPGGTATASPGPKSQSSGSAAKTPTGGGKSTTAKPQTTSPTSGGGTAPPNA